MRVAMLSFKNYIQKFQPINELAHLSDFLNKKGNSFLNELLDRKVVVNLKIDQSAFVVANDSGEIKYFGREGKVQITQHRRQGADLYEDIISHLETRNLNKIPSGVFVYLEFFDDRLPTLIKYVSKPKNGMIISYVKQNGKILPPDHPINEKMATLLAVSVPPVLFSGKLNNKQKESLIGYAETPTEELQKKYGGKNFVQFVLSLFTPPSKMKYLMTDHLEGMVFYFDDGKKIDMAKINDPSFTQGIKDKGNKDDSYHKLLMQMIYADMERVSERVLSKGKLPYQTFIERMTKEYIRRNHDMTRKLNAFYGTVTANRFARLGFALLPSSVLNMVEKDWYAEDIYRTLHFMFEKEKKRTNPRTGLTKERKELINDIISRLRA